MLYLYKVFTFCTGESATWAKVLKCLEGALLRQLESSRTIASV